MGERDDTKKRIASWAEAAGETELPRWEELPSIPLYMDQVIFYLKEHLTLFQREEEQSLLTSSMINNYVKNGVLSHPDKKKYGKDHLGALMMVCMLKQSLPLQDIAALLEGSGPAPEFYEFFRQEHTAALREASSALTETAQDTESLKREALRLAVRANAQRAAAERILCELEKEQREAEIHEKEKGKA